MGLHVPQLLQEVFSEPPEGEGHALGAHRWHLMGHLSRRPLQAEAEAIFLLQPEAELRKETCL